MMKSNIENKQFSVESAFHASKVFEKGGPYADIIGMDSKNAKRDERLKESGKLISFKYADKEWDIEPKTMFYDWLYISALSLESNRELANQVLMYDAFTDIEFNPAKSINCQAKAVALYVSLSRQGILDTVLKATDEYINIITLNKTII